jgi:DNA repair exonuclease SbcCD nuclease subunit
LAIAEHRRKAFNEAFRKAVEAIIKVGCDYVFICGDLFERRTLRPHLVQFAHDQLYRLAKETEELHSKEVKILAVRGNHDGRPQSDTLDYLKHPLASYLHVFEEDAEPYKDENITVIGLNYYDRINVAYKKLAEPTLKKTKGLKILMLHGFVQGYNQVPPYSESISLDTLAQAKPDYVFTGHYHQRCKERRLHSGGWILSPGSLEMYDFGEKPEKGFYIVDHGAESKFDWIPIEPMHIMKRVLVETEKRQIPSWFSSKISEQIKFFSEELKKANKPGYLRIRVRGSLKDGFLGDIDLNDVRYLIKEDNRLLWVDIDTLGIEMPLLVGTYKNDKIDIVDFFSDFGDIAKDIQDMHGKIREAIEESASPQTGLLTQSQRIPFVEEWVKRMEAKRLRREDI